MKYKINKKVNGPFYITEKDEFKLNYRCKKEEQNGEGKGSCSSDSKKDYLGRNRADVAKSIEYIKKHGTIKPILETKGISRENKVTIVSNEPAKTVTIKSPFKSTSNINFLAPSTKSAKSYYQTDEQDKQDFNEAVKDLSSGLITNPDDYSISEINGVITSIDNSINKLKSELASTEKYYKEKLDSDDKEVGMNIFHLKNKISIMNDINKFNKTALKIRREGIRTKPVISSMD